MACSKPAGPSAGLQRNPLAGRATSGIIVALAHVKASLAAAAGFVGAERGHVAAGAPALCMLRADVAGWAVAMSQLPPCGAGVAGGGCGRAAAGGSALPRGGAAAAGAGVRGGVCVACTAPAAGVFHPTAYSSMHTVAGAFREVKWANCMLQGRRLRCAAPRLLQFLVRLFLGPT